MAVRYSQELTNIAGDEYRVDIIDDNFVGTSSEFILVDFELDWKGQQNDRSNFMTGSSCTVITQSTTSSNLDTLVSDILDAEEGQFTVAIYKKQGSGGGSYKLWWWGLILNDLSQGADETPTSYTITATDGLGILKGVPYENSGLPFISKTAAETLMTALQFIPYNSFFASSDTFLHTRVDWFETNMITTSDDPLNLTQIPSSAFYSIDSSGNYTFDSCYEVIETICNLFKARLFFANGVWRFYQIYDLENESNFNQYRYYFDQTQHSGTQNLQVRQTLTGGFSGGTRLATQTFESFAPLREVKQTFIHDSSDNIIKGVTFNQSTPLTQLTTSSVSSLNDAVLSFSGSLQTLLQDTASVGPLVVYVKVRMTLRLSSSYYLIRPISNQVQNSDYTGLAWSFSTSGPTDYVEFITVQNVNQFGGISIPINFTTPALPTSGNLFMRIEIEYVQDLQQNDISANYATQAILQSPYLEYIQGDAENERIYKTLNSTTAFFSDVLEFTELKTADRINSTTAHALKVFDGTDFIDSTADWGRDTLSGNQNIIRLGIEEFIAGQRKAVRKRQGDFVGQFEMYNVLGVSSEFFLFLGVQYFANDAKFSGEWYKVGQYDISGIVTTEIGLPIDVQYPPDAPSTGQTSVADPLPTNIEMYDGRVEIIENSTGTRKIVLNANDFNYIINQLAIGTDTADASALVSLSSTTKGFLLPRMTEAQRGDIASPATGLMVYQTDATAGIYVYNGSSWDAL
jgi:hypothetical protein